MIQTLEPSYSGKEFIDDLIRMRKTLASFCSVKNQNEETSTTREKKFRLDVAAHLNPFREITDPIAWQREIRRDQQSALQTFVEQEQQKKQGFRLRKCTYRGNGLHPDIQEGNWAAIRKHIYEDQGE